MIETAGADGEITLVQATIDTAGGNLYCKGIGSKEGSGKGFQAYFSHVLTRGYGIIQINGIGTSNGPNSHSGIVLNGTQIEAKDRALVLLSGTAGLGADTNHGIHLLGTTSIEAENGCIHFAGISNGQGNDNDGIWVEDGVKISSTKLAKVFMQGFGGPGVASNHGIRLSGSNSAITSNGGAVILLGQGRGTDTLNQGILLDHGINVLSKGRGMHAGPIILHGLGGLGSEKNNGIALNGRKTLISSVDSDILLTGVSHINDLTEPSVLIDFPSNIETKGRGRIRIKKETSK
ncbi:MAG: hypothetical protein JSS61_05115 [Verrucomicrobia bacterium]|nr:hypothetical protein [Verrucomicrobiota bacterium]